MGRRIAVVVVAVLCATFHVTAVQAVTGSVVINEIMYNPASDVDDEEYIELHNPGDTAVSLEGMAFSEGVTGTFGDVAIPAGGYVIVSPSAATSEATYGITPVLEFGGGVRNSGETITLVGPDGVSVVDTVTYSDEGQWPLAPDGDGPSLELTDPLADNDSAANWASSKNPTPGAQNSTLGAEPGVRFGAISSTPVYPDPSQPVTIAVDIEGATSAQLLYRVMFGSESSVPMTKTGNRYSAVVPGQAAGDLVRYRIQTNTGATFPTADDSIEDVGFVVRNPVTTNLPVLEWFITDADYDALNSGESRLGSTELFFPATVAYDGTVHTGVQVKIRGGGYARANNAKQAYSVEFPSGHKFEAPALFDYPVDEFALKYDFSMARGLVAWDVFHEAGFPDYTTFNVRIQKNGEFHAQYRLKEKLDGTWQEEAGLDTGQFFKAEGGFKYGGSGGGWDKKNPKDNDLTDIGLVDNLVEGSPSADELWDTFDVPNIVNYWAVSSVLRHQDQDHHNKYVYYDEFGTGLWSILPWDLDHTFGPNGNEPCVGDSMITLSCLGHPVYDAFWRVPEFRDMYFRRIRTLLDGPLAAPFIEDRQSQILAGLDADAAEEKAKWGAFPLESDDFNFLGEVANRRSLFESDGRIPSSQSSAPGVLITELQYRPVDGTPEFLELFNPTNEWIDISGWVIENAGLKIPGGTVMAPNSYAVFTDDVRLFRDTHDPGAEYLVVQYDGGLKRAGELLELVANDGTQIDAVDYRNTSPWEVYPDAGQFSLELADLALDNSLPESWHASTVDGGTPGQANSSGQAAPVLANARTLTQLLGSIDYKPAEHGEILRLYQAIFNREPDVPGAQYWILEIYEGLGKTQLEIAGFIANDSQPEFAATYGDIRTNAEFIDRIYLNMFDRAADADGRAYWLGQMNNGLSRANAARFIALSDEFVGRFPYGG